MNRLLSALRIELGPWGFACWALAMALVVGIAVERIAEAEPEGPPQYPAEAWQCGLDPADYQVGGCAEEITFCVGRCP